MRYIIIIAILIELISSYFLYNEYRYSSDNFYNKELSKLKTKYISTYSHFEQIAKVTFDEAINKPHIVNFLQSDTSIKSAMLPIYKRLQKNGFCNLEIYSQYFRLIEKFQNRENKYFLKRDRDFNLKDANFIYKFKLETKEKGKYFYVVFSVSLSKFLDKIKSSFNHVEYQFLIDSKIDNYKFKPIGINNYHFENRNFLLDNMTSTDEVLKDRLKINLRKGKSFNVQIDYLENSYLFTLYKPISENLYIISFKNDETINSLTHDLVVKSLILAILLVVLLLFVYTIKQKAHITKKLNRKLTKKIEELNENQEMLQEQLYTDRLTDLPNRFKLIKDVKDKQPTLILINIDSFKEINNFYGNKIGDAVLQNVTLQLKNIIKESDYQLYKMPADEFILLSNSDNNIISVRKFLKKTTLLLEERAIDCLDNEIFISLTSSIVINESNNILEKANMTLKKAKKDMLDHLVYSDKIDSSNKYESNINTLKVLKDAIEHDRILVFFQPIYNNFTDKIEKYEALVRLKNREGEIISPFFFLDIAKKSKLYPKITQIVVAKTLSKFENSKYEVSINISVEDILNLKVKNFILNRLRSIDFCHRIVFELVESEEIEDYKEVKSFIKEIKELGCKVAIDDFGSGYSNFAYLINLNIDYLKIDGSIIKNIESKKYRIVTNTIVNFAKHANIKTIAEFISSEEIFNMVKDMNIDYSQGFLIGKPSEDIID